MPIRASAFTTAKAIDLPLGSLFTMEQAWYLRAQLVGDLDPEIQVAIPLTGGDELVHPGGERCITLATEHSFECRFISTIDGPGRPLPRALTWTVAGDLVLAWRKLHITLGGFESNGVNVREAFYVTHWGVWVLDHDGKQISPDPLFVIGADQ